MQFTESNDSDVETFKVTPKEYKSILSRYGFLFEQSIPLHGIAYKKPVTNNAHDTISLFFSVLQGLGF